MLATFRPPQHAAGMVDEDACRRFERAWRTGPPAALEQFLLSSEHPNYLPTLEELVLIDLELSWKCWQDGSRGSAPAGVECYLEHFPELNQPAVVLRLVQQEWSVRRAAGDAVTAAEFRARFPDIIRTDKDIPGSESSPDGRPNGELRASHDTGTDSALDAVSPGPRPDLPGYEVIEEIARGGMGVVYKARHLELNRLVALKMILRGAHASREELQRFRMEARAAARIAHPHVVQIHEIGMYEGQPYMALELVEGGSLARKLAQGPLTSRAAAVTVETLARTVHAFHQRGILHRDLKPANVLLTHDGQPKIADFGLARQVDASQHPTHTGQVLGTPNYMAPEQAGGVHKQITPAVDVYALGAILYELITGRPPFVADDPFEVILQVLTEDPVAPRKRQPGVPRDLETICLKCLQKTPVRRYSSAEELAKDLERFLHGKPVHARPVGLGERALKAARRRPAALTAAILGILALAGLAVMQTLWPVQQLLEPVIASEQPAEQIDYFANFVRRWGVPEGIGRLAEKEVQARQFSYRVRSRAGKVETIEAVNGRGFPTIDHTFPTPIGERQSSDKQDVVKHECRYDYHRDEQGRLTAEVASDAAGNVLWTFLYTTPATGHFTDALGLPSPRAASGAAYVKKTYSDEGFEKELRYLDSDGRPRANSQGFFGERFDLDERGLPWQITALGANDMVLAKTRMVYDARGNRTQETSLNALEYPVAFRGTRYARFQHSYDAVGNLAQTAYAGIDGYPVCRPDGYAVVRYRYNDRGCRIEETWFGIDGQPATQSNGAARLTMQCDARGRTTRKNYFDPAGRPTNVLEGYASSEVVLDERAYPIEICLFGVDGRRVLAKALGFSRGNRRFDAAGRLLEETFFGVDDEPVVNADGIFGTTLRYDERGRLVEQSYFGTDNQPCLYRNGIARFQNAYDTHGNLLETRIFGVDGKPTLHPDGYARFTAKYDDYGNQTEAATFGVDDKPRLSKLGYARTQQVFDARGHLVEVTLFGIDDKPTLCPHGYARYTADYDGSGNPIEECYFGVGLTEPVLGAEGFARVRRVFDARGRKTEEAYFGLDGRPIRGRPGSARWTVRYNDADEVIRIYHFDVDGKPLRVRAVAVMIVNRGGEAERVGIKRGDIVQRYANEEIVDSVQLRKLEKARGEGARELQILRDGQVLRFQVEPVPLGVGIQERVS